ncbi:MAG: deoxyguanosinetriphosphate triphosphohydrolase [Flavobacterium sp.]|uniref:deoxyguanosinetriphosphate triphosphohydrolase n=1 Tax=unclassified Flavobacterium TaxID=196869 RepID=UPI00058FFCEA|nr:MULTISPECIES: deoxyguanosinetriphosphate triphosphohydrolase [unclassified Flavobacterium]MDP5000905.1 deoxyguanosinetriphosphate triphosphohydrolase [Flavobacterium sp.]MDP5028507.1 deoxyguanosinetriphosphate triphosphohydrolase [Flavobacterium sp.]MQP52722.1 deoxyguanosinetriphosphate triphosphohydrolase [Flavobacterium sp. LMO9]MQP62098.1 deoxyguanosinetriphosphate triphosphohydrolase [Flavobacterium sp. LMO6]
MQWEQLLSLKRQGDTSKRLRKEQDDTRLGFEVDYDRIIFSAAFRSLQDKTQVIPLSKTDFVHNRLTHSLEVSVVGRSLGRLVGKQIIANYPHLQEVHGYQANDFGAIVAAAALSHDIGNPPFGHSGEKAIGEYFKTGNGLQYKDQLTEKEWQDLIDFEGNANGFSVLAASREGIEGGLRISYATLGAFMKYPKESLPKKPTSKICDKKYGFFQSDKSFFNEVAAELGLISNKSGNDIGFERHPLAYLVEAADDICYTIIDFEDGINLGLIQEEFALEYLIKLVKNGIDTKKYNELITKEDRISYLRALAIGSLINDAVAVFMKNEKAILAGEFPFALMDKSQYKAQMNDIIQISVKNVYQSKEVIQKEVMGYKIINNLLDGFCTAYNKKVNGTASNYDELLLKLLPERFQFQKENLYDRLLHICHFVSLLTDGKALELYKTIQANKS